MTEVETYAELHAHSGFSFLDGSSDPEELAAEQIRSLPGSLNEAVADMERSELMAETLGEHVFEWFIRNKRAEWASYKTHISQFELDRYLPLL